MARELSNGKYPTSYILEEFGDQYMLGSDVGNFMGYYKGTLFLPLDIYDIMTYDIFIDVDLITFAQCTFQFLRRQRTESDWDLNRRPLVCYSCSPNCAIGPSTLLLIVIFSID